MGIALFARLNLTSILNRGMIGHDHCLFQLHLPNYRTAPDPLEPSDLRHHHEKEIKKKERRDESGTGRARDTGGSAELTELTEQRDRSVPRFSATRFMQPPLSCTSFLIYLLGPLVLLYYSFASPSRASLTLAIRFFFLVSNDMRHTLS